MTDFFYERDADLAAVAGQQVAVVGYGNQGRPWALNLRDSGLSVSVHVRADETREQAIADGFDAGDIADASSADVICVLIPDDSIPGLGLDPRLDALTIVASGYTLAFDRFTPDGDIAMVAPGCWARRCDAVTPRGSGSSPRWASTATPPAPPRPGCLPSPEPSAGCARVPSL